MPSSLTTNHPSASVCSTRPRVSVWSTDARAVRLSGFSRRHGYPRYRPGPEPLAYCQVRLGGWICLPPSLPTPFNLLFRQQAEVSLPRPRIARTASIGMLTDSSICIALRLIIRFRLTPGRLASPGNPWSCGGKESHLPYRYLCLHLLFLTLHDGSRQRFGADRNAPLPTHLCPAASARRLIPDYYPCLIPRLVSCYALFE